MKDEHQFSQKIKTNLISNMFTLKNLAQCRCACSLHTLNPLILKNVKTLSCHQFSNLHSVVQCRNPIPASKRDDAAFVAI